MDEQAIIAIVKQLIDAGAFENLQEPGKQTLIIYGLLSALIIAMIRIFLINGWIKKGLTRFFDLEEGKLKALTDLNEKVIKLQELVIKQHEKLHDVLHLLHAKREED